MDQRVVTDVGVPVDRAPRTDAGGPPVVLLAPAAVVAALALDLLLGGDLGLMFGLGFVTGCLWLGLSAPRSRFYVAALLPPVLMLVLLVLVGLAQPSAVGETTGGVQGVVAGFAHHSWALGLGYVLCLACLGVRLRAPAPSPAA